MQSWLRSVSVLGLAFGGVTIITLGIASFVVPGAAGTGEVVSTPSAGATPAPPNQGGGPVTAVGGSLTVTGDREATFVVDREATDNQGYSLAGEQGTIFFTGNPLVVDRISYDGLEFYVDEGDCTLTPGERHDPTGVAGAQIRCEEIADIRDGGTISIEGTVGVSADLLGMRGDMPPTGGILQVGDREIEFPFVVLFLGAPTQFAPSGGFLVTDDGRTIVQIEYDYQTHGLELAGIEFDGVPTEIPSGACSLSTETIGRLNPRTTTADLTIECEPVELASGETARISGTLIADLVEPPT